MLKTKALLYTILLLSCLLPGTLATAQQNLKIGPSKPPLSATNLPKFPGSAQLALTNRLSNGTKPMGVDGARSNLGFRLLNRDVGKQGQQLPNAIPYWSDSFVYQGLEFPYRMVGTDPKKGSRSTVIPTVIIPLTFIFPNGSVYEAASDYDGAKPVTQRIVESPIFQNYNYVINGTSVGNTQFGDAFQRANFWDSVSTRSPNYHVVLGQPTILPSQTIIVPADKDLSGIDPFTGLFRARVDDNFLIEVQNSLIAQLNITPATLPIFIWGQVLTGSAQGSYFAAEHFWASTPNGKVPYIGTSYFSDSNGVFNFGGNVYPLSHEVLEWLDDPFTDNHTPGWNIAFEGPSPRCFSSPFDILEVGDPLAYYSPSQIPIVISNFTYYVQDSVFLDFFTRAPRSRSINGQYSMFNTRLNSGPPVLASGECVGDIHPNVRLIDVPNSLATQAFGMNNQGDVVGLYADSQGFVHGFLLQNGSFRTLDFPGALATGAFRINEAGAIVGYFYDASINIHGFLYKGGRFQQIDFPGAMSTVAIGINSLNEIVGSYTTNDSSSHGFLLSHGLFQTVDSPFGTNHEVTAINDLGDLGGDSFTPNPFEQFGFLFRRSAFEKVSMPDALASVVTSLNNLGTNGGIFIDAYGNQDGFINLFGYFHEVNGDYDLGWDPEYTYSINDQNQIVGITFDPNTLKQVGFVGLLPIVHR